MSFLYCRSYKTESQFYDFLTTRSLKCKFDIVVYIDLVLEMNQMGREAGYELFVIWMFSIVVLQEAVVVAFPPCRLYQKWFDSGANYCSDTYI